MPKKISKPAPPYSGFVLTFEPERTEWLAERLYQNVQISESFSALDWKFERRELVLLVLSKAPLSIAAIAMMERMHGSGGSGKLKMRMSNMVIFEDPVAQSEFIVADLVSSICTPETLKRAEPAVWEALIVELKQLRPEKSAEIDVLILSRLAERRIMGETARVDRLNEQRDGLGLCLDIAKIDRSPILKAMNVEQAGNANSILELLDTIPIQERSLIEHDRNIFEELLGSVSYRSAKFTDKSERSVHVYVADKTDLETVLGIDLIIYNTCYDNFLLLQYKRMEKDLNGWSYQVSPSSNLHTQLISMASFRATLGEIPTALPTVWSYRLNQEPFYFKFCEQVRQNSRDDSLVPGITLGETHLREFLTLPEAKGPKEGLSVGYKNCPRYLNNTEFIDLARVGWIGAGVQATALLKKVLEANKAGGRSAMLAVINIPKDKTAATRSRKK